MLRRVPGPAKHPQWTDPSLRPPPDLPRVRQDHQEAGQPPLPRLPGAHQLRHEGLRLKKTKKKYLTVFLQKVASPCEEVERA